MFNVFFIVLFKCFWGGGSGRRPFLIRKLPRSRNYIRPKKEPEAKSRKKNRSQKPKKEPGAKAEKRTGAHGAPWGGPYGAPWGPRFFRASPARPPELARKNLGPHGAPYGPPHGAPWAPVLFSAFAPGSFLSFWPNAYFKGFLPWPAPLYIKGFLVL